MRARGPRHQRGKVQLGLLLVLVLAAGLGYLGYVYFPVFMAELTIKNEAKGLGNQALVTELQDDQLAERFVATIERRTGVEIFADQVEIIRDRVEERVRIIVEYDLLVEFPFLDYDETREVIVDVEVTRSQAY